MLYRRKRLQRRQLRQGKDLQQQRFTTRRVWQCSVPFHGARDFLRGSTWRRALQLELTLCLRIWQGVGTPGPKSVCCEQHEDPGHSAEGSGTPAALSFIQPTVALSTSSLRRLRSELMRRQVRGRFSKTAEVPGSESWNVESLNEAI